MSRRLDAFVDANILFSASYRSSSNFALLWLLPDIRIVTSPYAIEEIAPHIKSGNHRKRFEELFKLTYLVPDAPDFELPPSTSIVAKDLPILQAALSARCRFLITGDRNHFEHLFGEPVGGCTIIMPSAFLQRYPDVF